MIYTDEISASLDPIDDVVVFHRVEPTEVQRLAQQLAEKAVGLMDSNEKTMDTKLGQSQPERGGPTGEGGAGGRGKGERRGGGRGTYRGRVEEEVSKVVSGALGHVWQLRLGRVGRLHCIR